MAHSKPYPARGQIWERVSKRNLKGIVRFKVLGVADGRVLLEAINPQFKQKLNPEMTVDNFLHQYIFIGR